MSAIKKGCSLVIVLAAVFNLMQDKQQDLGLRVSQSMVKKIAEFEGCLLNTYNDHVGVLTVGIGHTNYCNDIKRNTIYTNEQIADFFIRDLKKAEDCLNNKFNGKSMPQHVFDSMTSFTFNLGCRHNSTIHKYAAQGDWARMCKELPRWVYAGGHKSRGLVNRRRTEMKICLNQS